MFFGTLVQKEVRDHARDGNPQTERRIVHRFRNAGARSCACRVAADSLGSDTALNVVDQAGRRFRAGR